MTQSSIPRTFISRDLALRIGLAARALPNTDSARLIEILIGCVGAPLTLEKLARLQVKDLKNAGGGELADVGQKVIKESLRLLQEGASIAHTDKAIAASKAPEPQAYAEGDMPGSVRVACASNHGDILDGHFGSCAWFLIYQVSAAEKRLIDVRSGAAITPQADKTAHRIELIRDCHMVYVLSIGGPAAAKVVNAGVHPVKLPKAEEMSEILARLQHVLSGSPPPWLAKAMKLDHSTPGRYPPAEVS